MTEARVCPQCQAELPPDAPAGLCPRCLFQQGLAGAGAPTTAHPGQFTPPTPGELTARLPQFEVLELLGQGGMGAVYKARQKNLDRLVALKILPPEAGRDPAFAERFAREARALARLSHPHIVGVYDFGAADALYYLVMEYVAGVNLRQAIRAGGLTPKDALAIVPQVCDALQFAHDEGVVHRDVKPENILLDRKGRVKIADFGLAKLLGSGQPDVSLTGTQQVMGTLRYMAPEQMEGSKAVDHRADIYSLGVVFYELLTGELPVGRFPPPSRRVEVDVRLDEVVLRALEREPELRYQHASEVKTEVETIRHTAAAPPAAPVPDHVLAGRVTISTLVLITLAQVPFLALTWGYLADAEWYFEHDPPYSLLTGWWVGLGVGALMNLAWWWYLLAKDPREPRSLDGFLRLCGTPDPRMRRLLPQVFGFLLGWMAATLSAMALTSSDDVHTVIFSSGFVLAPYVLMAAVWRAYRAPRPAAAPPRGAAPVGQVRAAATALLAVGVLMPVLAFLADPSVGHEAISRPLQRFQEMMPVATSGWLSTLAGLFVTAAAWNGSRLRGRGAAVAAAVLAMLPVSLAFVVGIPVGIWALVVLNRPEVKAAFAEAERQRRAKSSTGTAHRELRPDDPGGYLMTLALEPSAPGQVLGEVGSAAGGFFAAALGQRWVRTALRFLCTAVYAAGLVAFFSFHSAVTTTGSDRVARLEAGQPSPWLVAESGRQYSHWSVNLLATSNAAALLGLAALALARRLERLATGKVHPITWHYVAWALLFLLVLTAAVLKQSPIQASVGAY